MKSILLIGIGRFGMHIAQELYKLGHQVMAIDKNEDRVNAVLPYVTNALIGDSADPAFLQSLEVRLYDVCIVAVGDDFQNSLEITSQLKEFGAKHVIARASTDIQEKFLLRNGADEVVYPEKQLANWTAIRCTSSRILDFVNLDGEYDLYEMKIPPSWVGKTVLQTDVRKKYGINILGIRHEGKFNMSVHPDSSFAEGDSVLVLSRLDAIQKCFHI